MSTEINVKTCRMCCMEIPAQARKCPHCHHLQNRLSTVLFHPLFAVAFVLLISLSLIGVLVGFRQMLDQGEDFQIYAGQIQVTQSEVSFGDSRNGPTVAVIGTVTNASSIPWKQVVFHADFSGVAGNRADVGQREEHSFYLPAGEALPFKVSFRREFPESNYVNHSIRVLNAKDARARW